MKAKKDYRRDLEEKMSIILAERKLILDRAFDEGRLATSAELAKVKVLYEKYQEHADLIATFLHSETEEKTEHGFPLH